MVLACDSCDRKLNAGGWRSPLPHRHSRRVAQAFDLAGAKNIVGAPSFAHLAKGGNLERMRDWVAEPQKLCRQHRDPPLQKTQGRGTLSIDGAHRHHQKGGPPGGVCDAWVLGITGMGRNHNQDSVAWTTERLVPEVS